MSVVDVDGWLWRKNIFVSLHPLTDGCHKAKGGRNLPPFLSNVGWVERINPLDFVYTCKIYLSETFYSPG